MWWFLGSIFVVGLLFIGGVNVPNNQPYVAPLPPPTVPRKRGTLVSLVDDILYSGVLPENRRG